MTPDRIVELVRQAGVTGAGGAGFPTYAKYRNQAELVIANGAECEPLLYTDRTVMVSRAAEVTEGLSLAMRTVGAEKGVIALKRYYRQAIQALKANLKPGQEIFLLDDFYPAGDEFNLVYEVTGKVIPEGGLPLEVGVVVSNVGTLMNVAAAAAGRPVTDKFLTVNGEVGKAGVYQAPVGTAFKEVIEAAGGTELSDYAVISGGPMMGRPVDPGKTVVTKTCSGILVLPRWHKLAGESDLEAELSRARSACEGCRICTDLCTRYLLGHRIEPHLVVRALSYGQDEAPERLTAAFLCCQCGICDLTACPCGLSPRALYRGVRSQFDRHGFKNIHHQKPPGPRLERSGRKISSANIKRRLGISKYNQELSFVRNIAEVKSVRIPLLQHIGLPARPVVAEGSRVKKGQLLAAAPDRGLGVGVHASLSGKVTEINSHEIVITRT
ncbi:MAG: 4Fe-4S dicluster domain-containing protein [bacterium]